MIRKRQQGDENAIFAVGYISWAKVFKKKFRAADQYECCCVMVIGDNTGISEFLG
ncbi:MAG: hypothetical protein JSR97_00370 [Verrucomicrobia bacterium]|nr:hypothetical protein [Verrucomicrobiota bacterium]